MSGRGTPLRPVLAFLLAVSVAPITFLVPESKAVASNVGELHIRLLQSEAGEYVDVFGIFVDDKFVGWECLDDCDVRVLRDIRAGSHAIKIDFQNSFILYDPKRIPSGTRWESEERIVTIQAGSVTEETFVLRKATGDLVIKSPIENCYASSPVIRLQGRPIPYVSWTYDACSVPWRIGTISGIGPGTYQLEIQPVPYFVDSAYAPAPPWLFKRWLPTLETVSIEAGKVTEVEVFPRELTGSLRIGVDAPTGPGSLALVRLDGKLLPDSASWQGEGTIEGILPGTHEVVVYPFPTERFSSDGFPGRYLGAPQQFEVVIESGKTTSLVVEHTWDLAFPEGSAGLSFGLDYGDNGVFVFHQNRLAGLGYVDTAPGKFIFSAEASGRSPEIAEVEAKPEKLTTVTIDWEPNFGSLEIHSSLVDLGPFQEGAGLVFIDGLILPPSFQCTGSGNETCWTIPLTPGSHEVRVDWAYHESGIASARVAPGSTTQLFLEHRSRVANMTVNVLGDELVDQLLFFYLDDVPLFGWPHFYGGGAFLEPGQRAVRLVDGYGRDLRLEVNLNPGSQVLLELDPDKGEARVIVQIPGYELPSDEQEIGGPCGLDMDFAVALDHAPIIYTGIEYVVRAIIQNGCQEPLKEVSDNFDLGAPEGSWKLTGFSSSWPGHDVPGVGGDVEATGEAYFEYRVEYFGEGLQELSPRFELRMGDQKIWEETFSVLIDQVGPVEERPTLKGVTIEVVPKPWSGERNLKYAVSRGSDDLHGFFGARLYPSKPSTIQVTLESGPARSLRNVLVEWYLIDGTILKSKPGSRDRDALYRDGVLIPITATASEITLQKGGGKHVVEFDGWPATSRPDGHTYLILATVKDSRDKELLSASYSEPFLVAALGSESYGEKYSAKVGVGGLNIKTAGQALVLLPLSHRPMADTLEVRQDVGGNPIGRLFGGAPYRPVTVFVPVPAMSAFSQLVVQGRDAARCLKLNYDPASCPDLGSEYAIPTQLSAGSNAEQADGFVRFHAAIEHGISEQIGGETAILIHADVLDKFANVLRGGNDAYFLVRAEPVNDEVRLEIRRPEMKSLAEVVTTSFVLNAVKDISTLKIGTIYGVDSGLYINAAEDLKMYADLVILEGVLLRDLEGALGQN